MPSRAVVTTKPNLNPKEYPAVSFFHWLINMIRHPEAIIAWGGYPGLALVVFAETGAMIFFFRGTRCW